MERREKVEAAPAPGAPTSNSTPTPGSAPALEWILEQLIEGEAELGVTLRN